jgi:hypothetical protein
VPFFLLYRLFRHAANLFEKRGDTQALLPLSKKPRSGMRAMAIICR